MLWMCVCYSSHSNLSWALNISEPRHTYSYNYPFNCHLAGFRRCWFKLIKITALFPFNLQLNSFILTIQTLFVKELKWKIIPDLFCYDFAMFLRSYLFSNWTIKLYYLYNKTTLIHLIVSRLNKDKHNEFSISSRYK